MLPLALQIPPDSRNVTTVYHLPDNLALYGEQILRAVTV